MNTEVRIKRIEKVLKMGSKPKLLGEPLEGCWSDELEEIWLEKACKAGVDLYRPILGGRSINIP